MQGLKSSLTAWEYGGKELREWCSGPGVGDGFKWTHKRLASSTVESRQSEIAWAQELVRSSERSPAEQRKAAPLGGHSP